MLLFALILALSPAVKYAINNYGEQIVGRQLHAEQVIINPYWGGVTIKGFECKEANGETNFVSFDRLYVQIAWPRLFGKEVLIRAIHLDGFNGQVLKSKDKVNFSDIIERFAKKDSVPADDAKSDWTISLKDIRINNSAIRYRDVINGKQWKFEDLSLHIPGLYFDNTQTNAGLEFGLPTGGRVGIVAGLKMQSSRYAVKLNLYDVHTDVVLPLVQDYLNVSGLGAKINGTIHVDGSLDVITNILLKGDLAITGLSLRDNHNDEIAAMNELRASISKGDVATNTYILDSLVIDGLTGTYEVHESWNTFTRLMKEHEPDTVATPKESKPLVWMAKRVTLTGNNLQYHDYSMKHNWKYAIKSLRIDGQNVASNGRNSLQMKATLTNNAQLRADMVGGFNLKKQDTRLNLKLVGVHLEDFDPLCRNYTAYPLEGGILSLESHMDVTSGKMKGTNRIEIDHPRVGKKERFNKAKYRNVPVRLGVKMLTSAQDMVLLDIPLSGDVNSPKFKFGKVIGRALLKVFFGPLMGLDDRDKAISKEEFEELEELLGEDASAFRKDSLSDSTTYVAVPAGDSVPFSEVSEE